MLKYLTALGLSMCVWIAFAEVAHPPKKFTLILMVVDSITKTPLEDASVTIPELKIQALTSASGKLTIDSVAIGFYTLQVSYIGYHAQQVTVWLEAAQTVVVDLCPASTHLHEAVIESHTDELMKGSIGSRSSLNETELIKYRNLTLTDQLKTIAGVNSLSNGPAITKPVIRGLHSNRLVTVNNGIRLEGQQWGGDHGIEIDPFSVAQAEVIKGAAAVEYGAEAIGGVVRLQPKPFRSTEGIGGNVQLTGAGNNGLYSGSLFLEGHHFEQHPLSWRSQFTYRKAGDSRTPNYVMSNTGMEETDVNFALHYALKSWHAEVSYSLFQTTLGILRSAHIGNTTDLRTAIERGQPTFIAPFTYAIQNPRQEVQHHTLAAKVYHTFKHGKVLFQYSKQLNNREEFDRAPRWSSVGENTPAYALTLHTDLLEAKVEHERWKKLKGQLGVSWMNQGNVTSGVQPIIPNFRAYTTGIFLLEKWNHGRWGVEAGLRYDYRWQSRYVRDQNQIISNPLNYQNIMYTLGASSYLNEHTKLYVQFASAWRPPAINELYSYGLHGGTATFEVGDENLVPERSYNSEAGIEVKKEDWQLEWNVFYNRINQFIYRTPLPFPTITIRGAFPQLQFTQHNVLLAGSECKWSGNYRWLYGGFQTSYLYAQNLSMQQPLVFMPANRGGIWLGGKKKQWGKLSQLFAEVQVQHVMHQHRYPPGLDLIAPPPAYWLAHIQGGFNISLYQKPITISMSIYNVMNNTYRDYLSRLRYFTHEPGVNAVLNVYVPF